MIEEATIDIMDDFLFLNFATCSQNVREAVEILALGFAMLVR